MGETPFSMTYGTEAVLPIENSFPTLRSSTFTPENNDELLGKSLDLTEEKREKSDDPYGLLSSEAKAGI